LITFEKAFAGVQKTAETAAQAATKVAGAAKVLAKTARQGDLAKLRKAVEQLGTALDTASTEVSNARESWPFSGDEEEEYLRNEFETELLAAAKAAGVSMVARDEGLVCFPSLLKVVPGERAMRIDRKRVATLRPSFLVAALYAAQAKKSRFDAPRFLESLYNAYVLLVGEDEIGSTIPLVRVHEVFTLLPGAAAEYGQAEFGRDLLMLDQSNVTNTKRGATISLPASTGTKGSRTTLSIVGRDGNVVTYYGLRFTQGVSR
jgi:hypothetical protein